MRNKFHITLYVVLIGFGFLMSCSPSSEEKDKVSNSRDLSSESIENNKDLEGAFEADTLNTLQLEAFQQRARQKVQDFINCVEIISNKSYNAELRDVSIKQIKDLFADSTVFINIQITKTQKIPSTISHFLNEVNRSDYDSIKVKTDSVVLSQPEKSKTSTKYIGAVSAKVTINGFKDGKIIFSSITNHTAETCIIKTQKQFGTETKMVWEAAIGELK